MNYTNLADEGQRVNADKGNHLPSHSSVSYTHLTLPTIVRV